MISAFWTQPTWRLQRWSAPLPEQVCSRIQETASSSYREPLSTTGKDSRGTCQVAFASTAISLFGRGFHLRSMFAFMRRVGFGRINVSLATTKCAVKPLAPEYTTTSAEEFCRTFDRADNASRRSGARVQSRASRLPAPSGAYQHG